VISKWEWGTKLLHLVVQIVGRIVRTDIFLGLQRKVIARPGSLMFESVHRLQTKLGEKSLKGSIWSSQWAESRAIIEKGR
jgi:hypothetical protein